MQNHIEKYNLTWTHYSDHLKSMMKELMMNEDFSDVTLVTEDKKRIKANIHILSSCSPFFKDILKKEKNSNAIMYLRDIQYSEMESIMQFIYLGEATFYEERMDDLLAVARSLEIKELSNTAPENDDLDDGSLPSDPLEEIEIEKDPGIFEQITEKELQDKEESVVSLNRMDEGLKYSCGKCDYQANRQYQLTRHIQSKHEGIKYSFDRCNY